MKARHWSLAIVLILVNYLIFATLFSRLLQTNFNASYATRTPVPTFTPAPADPIIIVPTPQPEPTQPTPTATRVLDQAQPAEQLPAENAAAPANEPSEASQQAQLITPGAVNIRSGPGINYTVIGALSANTAMPIVGRNGEGSWWQIKTPNDTRGWVANSVVNVTNADAVPVAQAPPPPTAPVAAQPAADTNPAPAAPEPEQPKYQYSPTGWYDDGNAGLTRFLGDIKDANGNPVNGVFVQAACGDYSTISYPSGPVGWGNYNESGDWPPGFYDITIDTKPVPCLWTLTIVESDDRKTVKARLSEAVPVEITNEKSIVTANWRKNW